MHWWFDAQLDQKILDGLYSRCQTYVFESRIVVNVIDFSKIEEAAFLDNMFVRISIVSSKAHSVVQGISIFWRQNWFHISVIQDLSMTRSFFSNCSFFPAR